jgi:hypothetical protein
MADVITFPHSGYAELERKFRHDIRQRIGNHLERLEVLNPDDLFDRPFSVAAEQRSPNRYSQAGAAVVPDLC